VGIACFIGVKISDASCRIIVEYLENQTV